MPGSIRTAYRGVLNALTNTYTSGRDYWTTTPPNATRPYTVTEISGFDPVRHLTDKSSKIQYEFQTHMFFDNPLDAHAAVQAVSSDFTHRINTSAENTTYDQEFEIYLVDAVENPLAPVDATGLPVVHWILTLVVWAQQE